MPPSNKFEEQFCRRYQELQTLVKSKDEFDKQRISANLRLLLLDGLMHQANRRFKLSIKFRTTYYPPPTRPVIAWTHLDGIYPPNAPPRLPVVEVDLKRFLAKPVMKFRNNVASIKDIIKFEANVKGGVHIRDAENQTEISIDQIPFRFEGGRISLRQLAAIGLVTLDALKPLYDSIMK